MTVNTAQGGIGGGSGGGGMGTDGDDHCHHHRRRRATPSTAFTLTVVADATPVACATTFVGGTPKRVEVTVSDAGSGLAAIEVTAAVTIVTPVIVSPSSREVGTTAPVVITATKIDQSAPAQVAYVLTDRSGNRSCCA
jgi:hypothetical protein